jgi:hypothetical protein
LNCDFFLPFDYFFFETYNKLAGQVSSVDEIYLKLAKIFGPENGYAFYHRVGQVNDGDTNSGFGKKGALSYR